MKEESESERQQWYAGLPPVGSRPLTEEERAGLLEIRWQWRRRLVTAFIPALGGPLLALIAWNAPDDITQNILIPALGLFIFSLITHAPRRFAETRYWLRGLRRDLAEGSISLCTGPAQQVLLGWSTDGNEPRRITTPFETGEEMTLEILPHSHLLWSRNGTRMHETIVVSGSATAALPEHAAMAANFVQEVRDDLFMHQRALSVPELVELDSYAPRVTTVRIVLAVVSIIGSVAAFTLTLLGRTNILLPAAVFFFIALRVTPRIVRELRGRRRIGRDIALARVLIVRRKKGDELAAPIEVLPTSGILWTEAGAPANWRKVVK
jgi:hypothetical protein